MRTRLVKLGALPLGTRIPSCRKSERHSEIMRERVCTSTSRALRCLRNSLLASLERCEGERRPGDRLRTAHAHRACRS